MATRWEAASAVAIAFAVIAWPVAAQDRPLYMTIVVQDLAELSPAVIKEAETLVTRIYSQIGVRITWRNIVGFEEPTAIDQAADVVHGESIIHVGLLSAEMEHRVRPDRGTLGMTISGTRLVRVFVDRVEHVARSAEQGVVDVLGHVIAHEIGHVLLGPDAHSTVGLMAASLDLARLAIGGLWFDRIQAAIIRARLACDISRRGLPAGDGPGWVPPTIRRLSTACEFLSPIPANGGGPNAVVQEGAMARTTACSSWEPVIIAAVVLTGFTKPAAAGQASAPQLAVGIQDEANVPARIMTVAQAEVARVFRRAGVETIWVATTTADLVIVIRSGRVAERTSLTPDTTGQATVNSATGRGRLAYVFYNHIEERRLTTLNPAEFLGHIISHEIGHLLGIPHVTTGIMRAMWDRADLVLASEGLLLFRPDQAALLRHRLAREL